jgi:hypothetical protein
MAKTRIPKNLSVAELNKLQAGQGTTAQRSRIARLLANPGTRHLLADRFLTPAQQSTRSVNTRLAQPVVPGSDITNRDLAKQRNEAAALKYGGAEAQAGRDIASRQAAVGQTAGFFDNYLAELRAHEANQAQINAQSQAATQGLAGSIQGLGTQAGQVVAQGNQSLQAATGMAPASVTQDASNASMLRQALTASFGAMLAGQGANASGYADTLAHVVGPGQKLQGLTRAQGDVTKAQQTRSDLAKEKGAFEQQFEDEFRTNESKNVLAARIANVKSTQEQSRIDLATQIATGKAVASTPEGKAAVTTATEEAKNAAKLGMSVHQYRQLGPTERQRRLKALKATTKGSTADSRYTSGPFAGMLKSDVNALSDQQAQAKVDAYNKDKPKDAGKGPEWQPQARQSAARSQVAALKRYAEKAKRGEAFVAGHQPSGPLPRNGPNSASAKIQQSVAAPDDPILVTAALDSVYNNPPGLSAATVRKLIAAGYKPSLIAQALGVPTAGGQRSTARTSQTTRPGQGSATARR